MEALLKVATPKKYKERVLVEDFIGDMQTMYIVVSGQVAISIRDKTSEDQYQNFVVGQGEFFGGLALVRGQHRVMRAITLSESVILETTLQRVEAYKGSNADGGGIFLELMKRSRAFNQKVTAAMVGSGTQKSVVVEEFVQYPSRADSEDGSMEIVRKISGEADSIVSDELSIPVVSTSKLQQTMLMPKAFKCPMCKTEFKSQSVRETKLKVDKPGDFFMNEFKEIDPLWFEIIVCPECCYIEKASEFEKHVRYNADKIVEVLKKLDAQHPVTYSEVRNSLEVARAYRRYEQCLDLKDVDVKAKARGALVSYEFFRRLGAEKEAAEYRDKAFEYYTGLFKGGILDVTDSQMQQLYLIIGKLHEHRGEKDKAKNQYRLAKMMRGDVKREFAQLAEDYIIDLDMTD